uniref:Uncharacterized protein n=1 Tax=Palpitomonas bilix TaxID=652834 RepID=A0A7S3D683_9EUKA
MRQYLSRFLPFASLAGQRTTRAVAPLYRSLSAARFYSDAFKSPLLTAANPHQLTPADIWSVEKYDGMRKELLKVRRSIKLDRRVEVGPYASITFENYDLLWFQTQEMCWIERGGDEQLRDELNAYNPLVPNGNRLGRIHSSLSLTFFSHSLSRALFLSQRLIADLPSQRLACARRSHLCCLSSHLLQ